MKLVKVLSSELVEFFKNYVELDTSLRSGENYPAAVDLIVEQLERIGLRVELHEIPEKVAGGRNRVHVVGRRMEDEKLPTLLIYNHMDVVPADYDGAFEFVEKDSKVFGRGVADHKGSTVALLSALEKLKEEKLKYNLIFWVTTDEETDQNDQLVYMTSKLKLPKDTLVFNPDTFAGGVTVGHLGLFQFDLEVRGKSAHSGMSNMGVNAVEQAGKLINGFFKQLKSECEGKKSKFETFKSVGVDSICSRCNVNVISGGIAGNVVPNKCTLTVDCRYIPEADVGYEKELLKKRLMDYGQKEGIDLEIMKELVFYSDGEKCLEAERLNEIYENVAGEGGLYGVMGSSPVSHWLKDLKLPHFGIGVIRADSNIHGVGEFCYVEDVDVLSETVYRFLRD